MDHEELAWAGGFFDAEGSSVLLQGRYPSLAMGQVERENLDRFRAAVRVGSVTGPYPPRTGTFNKSPYFQYQVYRDASVASVRLWPYLQTTKRTNLARVLSSATNHAIDPDSSVAELNGLFRVDGCDRPSALTLRLELAWAAGFFDGDGCFFRSRSGSRVAAITQIDGDILLEFQRRVGVGKVYGPRQPKHEDGWNRKASYQWRTTRFEEMQAVTAMLWFKLGEVKRRQASRVLDGSGHCVKGHFKGGGRSCPTCVAAMWARKREAGLCWKGHYKQGLKRCPVCNAGGSVGEDAVPYAA